MVSEQVESILGRYYVNITKQSDGRSLFINVVSFDEPQLALTLHFVNEKLYSISFLNNEFFELTDEDLSLVLRHILEGEYFVKKPLLFGKPAIYIKISKRKIIPERIHNDSLTEESLILYQTLPRTFSRKGQ